MQASSQETEVAEKMPTDEQSHVLFALNTGYAVMFQQAPAGIGKMYVFAKYFALFSAKRAALEVILVVAPTNLAVLNLANAIFETTCFTWI